MNWRYVIFFATIIISILSIILFIFFDFPFLFLLLLFPPIYFLDRYKESNIDISPETYCKECGKKFSKKDYKFCPYCGKEKDLND